MRRWKLLRKLLNKVGIATQMSHARGKAGAGAESFLGSFGSKKQQLRPESKELDFFKTSPLLVS